jgi:hypothetical protein
MADDSVPIFLDDFGRTPEQAMDPNDPSNRIAAGFATGVGDAVMGMVHAVTHPVQTLEGMASWVSPSPEELMLNPELAQANMEAMAAKGQQLADGVRQIGATLASGDAFEISRLAGNVFAQGLLMKGAGAGLGVVGRVTGVAEKAGAVGAEVASGNVPGAVRAAGLGGEDAAAVGKAGKRFCPKCKRVTDGTEHDVAEGAAPPADGAPTAESAPSPAMPSATTPAAARPDASQIVERANQITRAADEDATLNQLFADDHPTAVSPGMAYTVISNDAVPGVMENGLQAGAAFGKAGPNAESIWFSEGTPFYRDGVVLAIPKDRLLELGGEPGVGLNGQANVIRVPFTAAPTGIPADEFAIGAVYGKGYVAELYRPPAWTGAEIGPLPPEIPEGLKGLVEPPAAPLPSP